MTSRPAAEEAAPDPAIPGFREGLALLAGTEDFEALLKASLSFAKMIMDLELPEDTASAIKVMGLKKEVMASVLSAGVRVNDSALRKKGEDKVARMLAAVKGKTEPRHDPPVDDETIKKELFQ